MVIFGVAVDLKILWNLADLFMGIMALINLIAIVMLGNVAFTALKGYRAQRNQGKDPVFYADSIPGSDGVECWEIKEELLKKNKA
ncbi:alanine:cation symporter family protein [Cytobacillus depressus]|uniref:Alanine:cation symporter family protein n=1 Tax=Cytobacillus depressus TaxID=1602942 RepID=A0A6L3V6C1_9BACI|nr:alanine:cation symporter family protein [Cytobacillus depressus]